MAMDKFTLADELARVFGGGGRGGGTRMYATGGSGGTSTMYGTAVSDSAGGRVSVVLEGTVIAGDDEDNVTDMDTVVEVRGGDRVIITIVDGHPTVTGVVGWGDSVAERADEIAAAADAADAKAQAAQEAADKVRTDADAQFEAAKEEIAAFREDAEATYSTKTETDEKTGEITKAMEADYLKKGDASTTYSTKTETKASVDGLASTVSATYETKDDAAKTYSTKTELSQTNDSLTASISQTLADANGHADDAVAAEATARDSAISASADSIRSEVSSTYVRGDGTGTDTVTSTVKQNSTSIETMFTQGTGKTVKDTADAAKSTASSAKSTAEGLATLIRGDSTGITVGKSTDGGKTYSGNRTHMGASNFEILNKGGAVLARFADKLIELGRNSTEAVISLVNGQATISFGKITRGIMSDVTSGLVIKSAAHPVQILGHSDDHSDVEVAITTGSGNGEISLSDHDLSITLQDGDGSITVTSADLDANSLYNLNRIVSFSPTPVYCLYSGTDHYYTTDIGEVKELVGKGWKNQGVCFRALV